MNFTLPTFGRFLFVPNTTLVTPEFEICFVRKEHAGKLLRPVVFTLLHSVLLLLFCQPGTTFGFLNLIPMSFKNCFTAVAEMAISRDLRSPSRTVSTVAFGLSFNSCRMNLLSAESSFVGLHLGLMSETGVFFFH
jgi:hypothetical protein